MYDQPAGEWRARNYAASIWQLLEKLESDNGGKLPKLTPDEFELHEEIVEIEAKIDRELNASKPIRETLKRIEAGKKKAERGKRG